MIDRFLESIKIRSGNWLRAGKNRTLSSPPGFLRSAQLNSWAGLLHRRTNKSLSRCARWRGLIEEIYTALAVLRTSAKRSVLAKVVAAVAGHLSAENFRSHRSAQDVAEPTHLLCSPPSLFFHLACGRRIREEKKSSLRQAVGFSAKGFP